MSNTKLRPMRNYPPHWLRAMKALAAGGARDVVLERRELRSELANLHIRAMSMRRSAVANADWPPELKDFAKSGALRFRQEEVSGYWVLVAYRGVASGCFST